MPAQRWHNTVLMKNVSTAQLYKPCGYIIAGEVIQTDCTLCRLLNVHVT